MSGLTDDDLDKLLQLIALTLQPGRLDIAEAVVDLTRKLQQIREENNREEP